MARKKNEGEKMNHLIQQKDNKKIWEAVRDTLNKEEKPVKVNLGGC